MCLHSSAPCYFSGPHLGVISDNTLVKQYPPLLISIDERILGDKAYTDRSLAHVVIAPIKKKRNNSLTSVCEKYNVIHAWYRASIEHAFGYIKRFRIIGITSLCTDMHHVVIQCSFFQLLTHAYHFLI